MKYKVDLHTHSVASHDGGITAEQYTKAIAEGRLDYVAITDHNRIDFAQELKAKLGSKIIVGEEIMTKAGEIIGLFLTHQIAPNQTLRKTIEQIREQAGIVYIPHPFETVRKGLPMKDLEELIEEIDILEAFNGRAFLQNKHNLASIFARKYNLAMASSSDAHGNSALGKSYTVVSADPAKSNIIRLFKDGSRITKPPTAKTLLYPKYNKVRKKLGLIK